MQLEHLKGIGAAIVLLGFSFGFAGVHTAAALQGDANCDQHVDARDVAAVIAIIFGAPNTCATADVNGDRTVSVADVTGVALAFGPPAPTPTVTATPTITQTPSVTRTPTKTGTPTITPSVTRTPTPSRTASRTPTSSPTRTPSRTPTGTATVTLTRTVTLTPSITPTRTITPTPTQTQPLPYGPQITAFGLIDNSSNVVLSPDPGSDPASPVYTYYPSGNPILGAGFLIFVEARAGTSGSSPGTNSIDLSGRPDLQMEANQDLGNGSPAVCDAGGPNPVQTPGGVPGFPTPTFDASSQKVTDALNDLGCRFDSRNSTDACTIDPVTTRPVFVNSGTTNQFCTINVVSTEWKFHPGKTLLTVQWRDMAGNIGNQARLVVNVLN